MPAVSERSIRIVISDDALRAHLHAKDVHPASVTEEDILTKLNDLGIPVDQTIQERVKQAAEEAKTDQLSDEPILLAEGREPVAGVGARFEYVQTEDDTEEEDEGRADFHQSQIIVTEADHVIGTLHPEVPPQEGIDVYGKPIRAEKPRHSVQLGENVRLQDDGKTVVANIAGKVHLTHREVSVVEFINIPGDVDFSTGNINSPTDVVINGTIRETFDVKSSKSITVRGAIEACNIETGTDIQANGGIVSNLENQIVATGEFFAKYCEYANIRVQGAVTITREAMNCVIHTTGHLMVSTGALVGGYAYASEGAEIGELGNEADAKTTIAVGVDPKALFEARKIGEGIKKKKEAAERIREKVTPFTMEINRLTPQQREKMTQLTKHVEQLDASIAADEQRRKELTTAKKTSGEVTLTINREIHANVSVIFGDKMTTFQKERRGPFKIVRRVVKRVEEIVLVDKLSGSVTALPSREYEPEPEPERCEMVT